MKITSVADDGKNWKVTYSPPADALGGEVHIIINKKSGFVISDLGEQ